VTHPSPSPIRLLAPEELQRAYAIRDLTDPTAGPHAMQLLVDRVCDALGKAWGCETVVHRAAPVVGVEDNYDRLHYPPESIARDARYTRYVTERTLLRTHTTAMIPPLLRGLATAPCGRARDVLLVCAGLVYRRDCIDRLHTGEPHQLDLWRIRSGPRLSTHDLLDMIARVIDALVPGTRYRCNPASHPYTTDGLEIELEEDGSWVEIGECGLALPALLAESGLDPARDSGLAMGLGLDRLLMLVKGLDDIRLLRATDSRISAQMLDLARYRPVSNQPPVRRDLSIAVSADLTAEELGDRVRRALGNAITSLEAVEVLSETPYDRLPPAAIGRLGMREGQKNVLLRLVIRDLERTLTQQEANELRDAVYAAVHEGREWQWALRGAT
jgi:phenylalanyl-tRNA synthetase alpha chain